MKAKKFTFKLKSIEILDVYLKHPKQAINEIKNFNFNINVEQKVNNENKIIIVIIDIKIVSDDKLINFGSIKTGSIYEIENFDDFINKETNIAEFPGNILISLNSISLSTTRGMMYSQFRGTYLHNAYLPIIDPKTLQKKGNK